jgi:4-amino-4-deoxy-L-arabinose transferase-like glycosyltransferase
MNSNRSRLACIAIVVATIAVFGLLRVPFLSLPLERDEGEYAYIAQRAAYGEIPYRDAFDQKPPGVFAAYRLAFSLFGETIEGIHLFLYLWTAATTMVLFAFVRRTAGELAASFSALAFAVVSIEPRLAATAANTEAFMILPLVGSMYCLVRGRDSQGSGWWFACGLLAASACWFKQVAVTNAVFVGLAVVASCYRGASRRRSGRMLKGVLWFAGGAALVSMPVLAYFSLAGAWQPFVDAVFLHNLEYSQRVPASVGLGLLQHRLAHQAPSFAILWLAAAFAALAPALIGRANWLLFVGFAVASFAGVSVSFYFRPHYFVQLLPALAALSGVSLAAAAGWLLRRSTPVAWGGVISLALLVIAPPVWANRDVFLAESTSAISRQIYGYNPFPESVTIGRYIRESSAPGDEVLVVGSEPQILFYAERASATRYIFFYPLTAALPGSLDRQQEVVADFEVKEPLFVVWVNIAQSLLIGEDTPKLVFKAIADQLREHYRVELLARPAEEDGEYEFIYGRRATRVLRSLEGKMESNPWVAVYRRAG